MTLNQAPEPLEPGILFLGGTTDRPTDRYILDLPGMWTSLLDPLAAIPLIVLVATTVVFVALTSGEGVYKPSYAVTFTMFIATIEYCADWSVFIRCVSDIKYRPKYDPNRATVWALVGLMITSQVARYTPSHPVTYDPRRATVWALVGLMITSQVARYTPSHPVTYDPRRATVWALVGLVITSQVARYTPLHPVTTRYNPLHTSRHIPSHPVTPRPLPTCRRWLDSSSAPLSPRCYCARRAASIYRVAVSRYSTTTWPRRAASCPPLAVIRPRMRWFSASRPTSWAARRRGATGAMLTRAAPTRSTGN